LNEALEKTIEKHLAPTGRGERRYVGLRPKDAATLIILDRREPLPKVLMGRRHQGHTFMPGKFVFPGGSIDLGDRTMPTVGALHPRIEAALAARVVRASARRRRALALAAIRETYEETGVLLGVRQSPPGRVPDGSWTVFRDHGVIPDLSALHFMARAITPPGRPRRFDTRFFAVDRAFIAGEVEGVTGPECELDELAWVSLPEARRLDLPRITHVMLEELDHRLANGFEHELPVPFYYFRHGRFVRELL
jgi:8-oxo-dGTP pyrophosphatase MutT (NUDIX family)